MLRHVRKPVLLITLLVAILVVPLALGFSVVAAMSMGGDGYVLPALAGAIVAALIASRLVVALRHA